VSKENYAFCAKSKGNDTYAAVTANEGEARTNDTYNREDNIELIEVVE
jgi:hypothetical protein